MREAARANLIRQREGRPTWTAAVDADVALVINKITQLANDTRPPDERSPNVRELMNAMTALRTTTARLAAIVDDAEVQQLANISK